LSQVALRLSATPPWPDIMTVFTFGVDARKAGVFCLTETAAGVISQCGMLFVLDFIGDPDLPLLVGFAVFPVPFQKFGFSPINPPLTNHTRRAVKLYLYKSFTDLKMCSLNIFIFQVCSLASFPSLLTGSPRRPPFARLANLGKRGSLQRDGTHYFSSTSFLPLWS